MHTTEIIPPTKHDRTQSDFTPGQFAGKNDVSDLMAILNPDHGSFTIHPIEKQFGENYYLASNTSAGNFPTKGEAIKRAESNGYEVINKGDDFSAIRPVVGGPTLVFTNLNRRQFSQGNS